MKINTELTHQLDLIKQLRQAFLREAMQGKLVGSAQLNVGSETGHDLLAKIKAEKALLIKEKKLKKEKELPPITEDEIPFEIPEYWAWCRLGEISNIQRGSSPRPKGDSRYFAKSQTAYNWITIRDISSFCEGNKLKQTKEHLTEEGSKHSRFVDENEFIIAVSGSTTGKCCLTGIDGYIYDGLAVVKQINKNLPSEFLMNYMTYLYAHINNSKSGASFPNINTDFLNNLIYPLPPLHEQEQIVAKLEELMAFCDGLEQSIKGKSRV
ncbi:MAG: restriction endonuclease subunit S [Flavobacteriaceae bacterium]